ncbi:MAG: T9SS type A sorting domain-containing protein [Draconibacterium sp.]
MKRRLQFTIIILFVSILSYAQVSYTYDDSGNRESRYIPLKSAEVPSDSVLANEAAISNEMINIELLNPAFQEKVGELVVSIYPNPTKGAVYLNLNRLPENQNPLIEVWSPNGTLIEKARITGLTTRINLWGKPSGMYIVKSVMDGAPHSWKIIKE